MEENHDCFGDFSNIMTDYPDITTLLDDVPEEETDATQLNCETINMTSDTLDDLVNMDLSSPISSSNNTRSDPIRLSLPCIQPGPHPGFSPPHYANTSDPYGPGAQFVYPQPGHYATNYDYPNYSYPGSSSNYGQPDFTSEECISPPVGCGRLKKGGACYSLYNAINHASVAMNLYFLSRGRNTSNCDFKNSGLLSVSDPNMRYKVAELAAH
ncbi:hypothetical protein L1987_55439 [Smallanthus sonchifolius]|uniref:Uncharacterized protein n=1 Tax=Smallanthus sonchifolius TaxID=185202 RepID=A0ACB9E9T7_9ASTR|nr:hypothetical protein L1987_55439 [Smallanthus sonchifolius]